MLQRWLGMALFLAAAAALADDPASGGLPKPSGAAEGVKGSVYSDFAVPPEMGACHMCEWQPHPSVLPAPQQCGVAADGKANEGVFSCGLEKNCDKRCDFVKCQGS